MTPQQQDRLVRLAKQRMDRAKELLAYADTLGIEIGWEGTKTTFTPASECSHAFIQEATVLSREIKILRERRGH